MPVFTEQRRYLFSKYFCVKPYYLQQYISVFTEKLDGEHRPLIFSVRWSLTPICQWHGGHRPLIFSVRWTLTPIFQWHGEHRTPNISVTENHLPIEERQIFKQKIDKQIRENNLQGIDHIWYVSALNPNHFPHWLVMVDSLTNNTNYISNNFDPIDYLIYE
ncbi:unnamed protein product [Adineta steineri]|uniref:Uncharacterized protein n=1 Tax=Adineta steineri TaxID=433720 RepID=A0A814TC89_9BILA|nr:unnamed protein product [Adineta steineri]CAF1355621.1 unnamed protein product [Adineta steineri]